MLPMTSFFITINLCVHSCKNFRFLYCCCCCRCCLPVVVVCLDNANTVHFTMISGMERCGILNFYSILIDKIWSPCVHLLCSVHVHVWNLHIDMTIWMSTHCALAWGHLLLQKIIMRNHLRPKSKLMWCVWWPVCTYLTFISIIFIFAIVTIGPTKMCRFFKIALWLTIDLIDEHEMFVRNLLFKFNVQLLSIQRSKAREEKNDYLSV